MTYADRPGCYTFFLLAIAPLKAGSTEETQISAACVLLCLQR